MYENLHSSCDNSLYLSLVGSIILKLSYSSPQKYTELKKKIPITKVSENIFDNLKVNWILINRFKNVNFKNLV